MVGNITAKPAAATAATDAAATATQSYRLVAPGIRATVIAYGARLTSLEVLDRDGKWREVVVGHKDVNTYKQEASPSYYGCVVGRYANRIGGAKFTVNGIEYKIGANEHDGQNSLHGGFKGYDSRDWTVVSQSETSITFSLLDEAFEGFPGNVLATATYSVTDNKLAVVLTGHALDKATPILLTTHTFFRLGSDVSNTTLDDTLQLPGTDRIVAVDDILIPTGELSSTAEADHPLNYSSPRSIGDSLAAVGFCGKDSIGLDTCFVFDAPTAPEAPAPGIAQVVWTSPATGIRMQVHTNQPAVQLYNGLHFNGSQETQLGKVAKHGTLAIEPQGLIDGINHPEWKQTQVYSAATGPHVNVTEYVFDTVA